MPPGVAAMMTGCGMRWFFAFSLLAVAIGITGARLSAPYGTWDVGELHVWAPFAWLASSWLVVGLLTVAYWRSRNAA